MTPEEIIDNMKEFHGLDIELTGDVRSLISYVMHVSYGIGYDDGKKYSCDDLLNKIMNLGMDTRQKQIQGYEHRSGNEVLAEKLKEWR